MTNRPKQNLQAPVQNEDKVGLYTAMAKRITDQQAQIEALRKKITEDKLNQRYKQQAQQSGQSTSSSITDLKKILEKQSQARRKEIENFKSKMEAESKAKIDLMKKNFENEEIKSLKKIIQKQGEQIKQFKLEQERIKKEKREFDKLAVDINELAITKKLLEEANKTIAQISEKYANDQKIFKDQISKMGSQISNLEKQLGQMTTKLKGQLQKKEGQIAKSNQRIKLLQKADIYLQILAKAGDLLKEVQIRQIKALVSKYQATIKKLREQGPTTDKQKQIKDGFQKIVLQTQTYIKSVKTQKEQVEIKAREKQAKLAKQIDNVKAELKRSQDSGKDLQTKLKGKQSQLSSKIQEMQNLKISYRKEQEQKQKIINDLTNKGNQKAEIIKRKESQILEKTRDIQLKNDKILQLEKSIKSLKQQKASLAKALEDLRKTTSAQIEGLRRQLMAANSKIAKLEEKNTQLDLKIKQLQKTRTQLQGQIRQLKSNIAILERKSNELTTQLQKNQDQYNRLNRKYETLFAEHEKLKKDYAKLNTQMTKLKDEYQNTMTRLEDSQSSVRELETFRQLFEQVQEKLINELAYYIAQTKIVIDKSNPEESIYRGLMKFKQLYNQAKYFGGSEVLQGQNINFVVETINKFTQRTIEQSKLIYRYDPKNNVNFHQYIDGRQQLVVLVKLVNGYVVGGYSQYPVEKMDKEKAKQMGLGKGILFSVTKQSIYKMKKEPKMPVVSYDDFFFIFGNSEIRLKTQERKLFSNYGVAASTFDSLGQNKQAFMGQNTSEIEVLSYEFYQLKFR